MKDSNYKWKLTRDESSGPDDDNGNNDATNSTNGNREIHHGIVKWESKKHETHSPVRDEEGETAAFNQLVRHMQSWARAEASVASILRGVEWMGREGVNEGE